MAAVPQKTLAALYKSPLEEKIDSAPAGIEDAALYRTCAVYLRGYPDCPLRTASLHALREVSQNPSDETNAQFAKVMTEFINYERDQLIAADCKVVGGAIN